MFWLDAHKTVLTAAFWPCRTKLVLIEWAITIKRYFGNRLSALRSVCAWKSHDEDEHTKKSCHLETQTRVVVDGAEEDGGNSLTEWEKWEHGLMINDSNLHTLPGLLTKYLNSYQTGSRKKP